MIPIICLLSFHGIVLIDQILISFECLKLLKDVAYLQTVRLL